MTTQVELPADERFVRQGLVLECKGVGGGYDFAPPNTQVIFGPDDSITKNNRPCLMCGPAHMQRGTGFGRGSHVVVSEVHGHYVVRQGVLAREVTDPS